MRERQPLVEIERRHVGAYPEAGSLRVGRALDGLAEKQQRTIERQVSRRTTEQQAADRAVIDSQQFFPARRRRVATLHAQRNALVRRLAKRCRQIDGRAFERRFNGPRRGLLTHIDDHLIIGIARDSLDERRIDILFANQAEIEALAGVPHLESAVAAVRDKVDTLVVTRSEEGALAIRGGGASRFACSP